MLIFWILISLSIILIGCFACFGRDMVAPACILTAGFWLSALWGYIYQDHWNGFDEIKLFYLIVFGVLSFDIGCLLVKRIHWGKYNFTAKIQFNVIQISDIKYLILFLIEAVILVYTIYVVFKNTGASDLITAIGRFYIINKYGNLSYDPAFLTVLQYFNIAIVFIELYVVINNILIRIHNPVRAYVLIVIGSATSMLQGTRNTLFLFVISGIVMFYVMKNISNGWKKNLTFKMFFKIIAGVVLLVIFFRISIILTGRSSDEYTFIEILSTYVGSPIKNLELFIKDNIVSNNIFAGETMLQTYGKLYRLTENSVFKVSSYYTYRWIGGTGLGNVYTILMPLYADFGVRGACLVMFIIGVASQIQYDGLRRTLYGKVMMKKVIFYSYVSFAVAFSFFSAKYFEMVVSVALLYTFIGYFFISMLLFNMTVGKGKLLLRIGSSKMNEI